MSKTRGAAATGVAAGSGTILLTLSAAQFLMTLDSSVMNVSIATVAQDVGTTVTGIQTAITLYTLVMASFMITGNKIGQIMGYKRAFALGSIVYGGGSLTTALAPNLTVLILGWSLLEGLGAALIMPAIVALVAANFGRAERPGAYGLVAASGAVAVATGPLIGGLLTTYASWRYVFAGEVILVVVVLVLARRFEAGSAPAGIRLDVPGTVLSVLGLGLVVLGILRASEWGFVNPKPAAPEFLGLSLALWLVIAGGVVLRAFFALETRRLDRGHSVLIEPGMLANAQLRAGLTSFFFQYLLQAGLFFTVPLFLSVALGLSAVETGLRIMPLSITLLVAAVGVPKFFPHASPRRVVQAGFIVLFTGIVALVGALEFGAGPEIITVPLLLAGLGVGALASQLGSVTVSAVPDEDSDQVGGLQNTLTNLGASIGTALVGAVLISALTSSFIAGIRENPAVPASVSEEVEVELAAGIPFVSNAQLEAGLTEAGVPEDRADAIVRENADARIVGLRTSLAVLALIALTASFFARALPRRQPGSEKQDDRSSNEVAHDG